jgi:Aspartyl/asparaginyl-tRNA synthetases
VTSRTLINRLASLQDGAHVAVSGWVETVRDQKKVQFVVLHDETGAVQLVNPATRAGEDSDTSDPEKLALTDTISSLTAGSMVTVEGSLALDERVKLGGLEIKISSLTVESLSLPELPIAEDSRPDKRMDWRFIDLRRSEARIIFHVQTELEHAMRSL